MRSPSASLPDFRSIFEAVPGCYLILLPDAQFTIMAASEAYVQATNTKREQIIGKGLFTVFPDDPQDPHATGVKNLTYSLQTVLRTKKTHVMAIQKYDIPKPGGGEFEERYWSPQNSPVLDSEGTVTHIVHCVIDVTKQMKLEQSFGGMEEKVQEKTEQLYQANLFLDSIIENIPNMIFVKDAATLRFVRFNRAGEELLGYGREDLIGKNDEDMFPKKQAAFFIETDRNILKAKMPLDLAQETIQSKTKGERILHTRKVPVLNQKGEPEYLLGISEDITEHMAAQTELLRTKERLQLALEAAQIGVWEWDIAQDTIVRSSRHDQIFGYDDMQTQWTMAILLEHIIPDDRAYVQQAMDGGMRTGSVFFQCCIQRKDGTLRWIEESGKVHYDKDHKPVRTIGIVMDITDQKIRETQTEAEANLRMSQEILNRRRFQQAVESSTDAIMITSPDTSILYVNPAWQRLTGYSDKDTEGKKANVLKTDTTDPAVFIAMKAALNEATTFHSDAIVNTRKDGTTYDAELTIYPVREDNGNLSFFVGIHKDITQRKKSDRIKTEFASLASHQLRTPLSAVRLTLGSLLESENGPLTAMQKELIEGAKVYATDMAATIDTMLSALSIEEKKVPIQWDDVSLVKLSEKIRTAYTLECKRKEHTLHVECAEDLHVMTDPRLLEEALHVLLNNAVKYTPDGGQIWLEIRQEDRQIRLSVRDTGIGIPHYQRQKIFGKFFRADNALQMRTDGTGLGLYIAHAFISLIGGTLRCDTDYDVGCSFSILLPPAPADTAARS